LLRWITNVKYVLNLEGKKGETVGDLILSELEIIESSLKEERERFVTEKLSEKEKGKRLLFLFQKDLMPGINGLILESKDQREDRIDSNRKKGKTAIKGSSRTAKILAWMILGISNIGMLFYILLFALSQDTHRQNAWGSSFALWLVVEIGFVSSAAVLLMHVFIPSLIMRDVDNIKKKLITNVITFYQDIAANKEARKEEADSKKVFNSAEYLFLSHRLAAASLLLSKSSSPSPHPSLASFSNENKVAKMILSFQTPWPKQSYQHINDVSKKYNKKFSSLSRSFSIIILFFLSSLLSVPLSIQDLIIHLVSTTTLGYTLLIHLQLYQIFPVLIVVPTIFLGIIIHFIIESNKGKKKVQELQFMKELSAMNKGVNKGRINKEQEDGKRTSSTDQASLSFGFVNEEKRNHLEGEDEENDIGYFEGVVVEAPVVVSQELDIHGFVHRQRRESIKQGISLANKLDDLLYRRNGDMHERSDSDMSLGLSDSFSLVEEGNADILLSASSDDDDEVVVMLRHHRKAFLKTEDDQKHHGNKPSDIVIPKTTTIEKERKDEENHDDDEEAKDLFNLHLARSPSHSSGIRRRRLSSLDSDEMSSLSLSEERSMIDHDSLQAVSVSNTSLTSRILGSIFGGNEGGTTRHVNNALLLDTKRRSYGEFATIHANVDLEKEGTEEGERHDDDEEDEEDDLNNLHLERGSSPMPYRISSPQLHSDSGSDCPSPATRQRNQNLKVQQFPSSSLVDKSLFSRLHAKEEEVEEEEEEDNASLNQDLEDIIIDHRIKAFQEEEEEEEQDIYDDDDAASSSYQDDDDQSNFKKEGSYHSSSSSSSSSTKSSVASFAYLH
jgi:hypothetical protein